MATNFKFVPTFVKNSICALNPVVGHVISVLPPSSTQGMVKIDLQ